MNHNAMFYSYFKAPMFTSLPKEEKVQELKHVISNLELGQSFATVAPSVKAAGKVKLEYVKQLLSDVESQEGGRKGRKQTRKGRKQTRKAHKGRKQTRKH
jgi:hypothetical protein